MLDWGSRVVLGVKLCLLDHLRDRWLFARPNFTCQMFVMGKTIQVGEVGSIVVTEENVVISVLEMIAITQMPKYLLLHHY